ncbi:hypothetical protein AA0119_g8896 [Alternaria tenuissima]|jgi:hypothetical protein|uniref:Uncharacterized protein n=1 Tax=Alternaria tenuissima TaxID=119927 RepID=A0A4V1WL33_9PLEO|nr:hypothetical protein AA0114_g12221 [Alternaria tenuissima]RYN34277.1 hypothetical protein AA0115_g2637 [Alternaria tenuissima]RYN94687.1 hypothetical protein AA0119_g8896 [Alternaria tenuissima]RYO10830.1 hypothetical protein AA0121_g10446 [Alternaria tenuissima]
MLTITRLAKNAEMRKTVLLQTKRNTQEPTVNPRPIDKNDDKARVKRCEYREPATTSTSCSTFPFMRLPVDLRLCIYDQLAAMPVYRSFSGPGAKWIYYNAPSVGILRVNKLIRQEAHSITERGHMQMCPSITFKLPDLTGEWYNFMIRIHEMIKGLKCYTEYIGEQYVARCGLPRDLHPPTLVEMSSELRRHLLDGCYRWHRSGLWFHDEGSFTEFVMRKSLALHRGSKLAIRVIMDDNSPREGYEFFVRQFIGLQLACPTSSSITFQLSVPGDRVARAREAFGKPDYAGRYLSRGTWRVDVLEGDAVPLQ